MDFGAERQGLQSLGAGDVSAAEHALTVTVGCDPPLELVVLVRRSGWCYSVRCFARHQRRGWGRQGGPISDGRRGSHPLGRVRNGRLARHRRLAGTREMVPRLQLQNGEARLQPRRCSADASLLHQIRIHLYMYIITTKVTRLQTEDRWGGSPECYWWTTGFERPAGKRP